MTQGMLTNDETTDSETTTGVEIVWRRDPEAEAEMTKLGLEFTWVEGLDPQRDFSERESLANQGRSGDVNPSVVAKYAQKMKTRVSFPGCLFRKGEETKRYVFVGGNHRNAAALRVGGTVSGYLLTEPVIPAETLLDLTFWDNNRNGEPTTPADLRRQAVQLHELGYTQKEAAERMGLRLSAVQQAVRDRNATRKASNAGLDMKKWDELPVTVQRDLAGIKTHQGFVALTKLVMETKLPGDKVAEIVTNLNATNDADKHLADVRELEKVYKKERLQRRGQTERRGNMAVTPRTIFKGNIRTLLGLDPDAVASHYGGRVDRESAGREIDAAVAHLLVIKKALSQ